MGLDLTDFAVVTPLPETSATVVGRLEQSAKWTRQKRRFLKGPIPLAWLTKAATLPGGGPIKVALALCYQAGIHRGRTVKLTTPMLDDWGIDRQSRRRALDALEDAGLVSVKRERGKSPYITLLDVPTETEVP